MRDWYSGLRNTPEPELWSFTRDILPNLAIFVNGVRLDPEEIRYNKDGHFLDLTVPFKNG